MSTNTGGENGDGRLFRDEALARVERNAEPDWNDTVDYVIGTIADGGQGYRFTTDRVWALMKRDWPNVSTHERRAMGAAMTRAAKRGLIVKTDDYQPSTRSVCHARPIPVWRVL